MKYIVFIVCILIHGSLISQKEDNIWLFGGSPINYLDYEGYSYGNTVLDFDSYPPKVYYDSLITMDFSGTNSSICDEEGKIVMYTNGVSVHNGMHEGIIGSDTIGYGSFWEAWVVRDYPVEGENWIRGYKFMQGTLIIPVPGIVGEYYVIYSNINIEENNTIYDNIAYSTISFKEGQSGKTKIDNTELSLDNNEFFNSPKFAACRHANGRDWWLVRFTEHNDKLLVYLVESDRISFHHSYDNPEPLLNNRTIGQMYFSPDGEKFVTGDLIQKDQFELEANVTLYNFDRCEGLFSYADRDVLPIYGVYVGVSFSPSSEFLYISNDDELYQYDLNTTDLDSGRKLVGEWDGYRFKYNEWDPGSGTVITCMAHGPDGRIYSVPASSNRFLHTINYPDEEGEDCNLVQRSIMLNTSNHISTPNFPNYRLGPLDGSDCDTLGLDNHPIAQFRYDPDTTDYLNVRFTDNSYFRPESWSWDFGDGNTYEGKKPYYHKYESDGTYTVCLTVSNENSTDTHCEVIHIGTTSTDSFSSENISLFPNPTQDHTLLTLHKIVPKEGIVRMYNTQGSLVKEQRVYFGWNDLQLADLPSGVYLYNVTDGDRLLKSGKIVKQ